MLKQKRMAFALLTASAWAIAETPRRILSTYQQEAAQQANCQGFDAENTMYVFHAR